MADPALWPQLDGSLVSAEIINSLDCTCKGYDKGCICCLGKKTDLQTNQMFVKGGLLFKVQTYWSELSRWTPRTTREPQLESWTRLMLVTFILLQGYHIMVDPVLWPWRPNKLGYVKRMTLYCNDQVYVYERNQIYRLDPCKGWLEGYDPVLWPCWGMWRKKFHSTVFYYVIIKAVFARSQDYWSEPWKGWLRG